MVGASQRLSGGLNDRRARFKVGALYTTDCISNGRAAGSISVHVLVLVVLVHVHLHVIVDVHGPGISRDVGP